MYWIQNRCEDGEESGEQRLTPRLSVLGHVESDTNLAPVEMIQSHRLRQISQACFEGEEQTEARWYCTILVKSPIEASTSCLLTHGS